MAHATVVVHGAEVAQHQVMNDERRSEEHTSELQSRSDLVCRLLLEKKKIRRLNSLRYGKGTALVHDLVTNPGGTYLPRSQAALERDWKRGLQRRQEIHLHHLYSITR